MSRAAIDMNPNIRATPGNLFVPPVIPAGPPRFQRANTIPADQNKGLRLKIWHFGTNLIAMTKKKTKKEKKIFASELGILR